MVLQQTHSVPRKALPTRLDPSRILGLSSTLALNVLALLFLLMPMTLPSLPPVVAKMPDLIVVDIVPVTPATRPPPEIVPVAPPRPRPQSMPRETLVAPPATDAPVVVDQGLALPEASTAAAVDDAPPSTSGPPGPVIGAHLQYATATAPDYPRAALLRHLEGTVLLRVLVGVDGRPLEVSIEKSSGHAVLDREALRHVQRNWTFRPALRDGQPVQAVGIVPIDFRLDRG